MLVGPVAGVDDRAIEKVRHPLRSAILAMSDDDAVGAHRVERACGVIERLALLDRGLLDGEEDWGGTQPVRGGSERHRRPSRSFVE